MGCGISTLDAEDASLSRRSNWHRRRAIVPPPVTENNNFRTLSNKKDFENGDEGVNALGNNKEMKPLGDEEAKRKEVIGSNDNEENLLREKSMDKKVEEKKVGKEEHDNNHAKNVKNVIVEKHDNKHVKNVKNVNIGEDRYDCIIAPGSPSFRDYCINPDSRDRSSVWDSDDCDSGDSTKNGSDDGSPNMKNKPKNEESVNCNKEPEKKERSGRAFRNVINKGKARGKRNLLNFGCYNTSSESYPESSFDKTVGKTA